MQMTEEHREKIRAGRQAWIDAGRPPRDKKSKVKRPADPRAPRPETPPNRPGLTGVTAAMRKKSIEFVERLVTLGDAGAGWAMRRATTPIYRKGPDGEPMIDERGRAIIDGRVRTFDDATITEDSLEEWERHWLAEELTDELLRYKRIRTWILKMVELEERSSLPMCVTILALPRLARHGVIPAELRAMADEMNEAARKARKAPRREPLPEPQPEEPAAAAAD